MLYWLRLRWRKPLQPPGYSTTRKWLLVSTYIVCERLSVMHEPAGVVENLVQILQFTPILQYRIPPPKMKIVRNLGTLTFQLQNTPSPPKNWNLGRSWHFDFSVAEYPPPENENCQKSWHFDFSVAEHPPPPENWNLGRSWHFDFSVAEYPPPRKLKI